MSEGRVTVIQLGARRNYIYARLLHRAGLLDRLVTDIAAPQDEATLRGRLISRLGKRRRIIPELPDDKIFSSAAVNLVEQAQRLVHEERVYDWMDETVALSLRLHGVKPSPVVINTAGNGGSFIRYARARGSVVLTDFISMPNVLEIEFDERARWPDWERQEYGAEILAIHRARVLNALRQSDFYICPSQSVADGLAKLPGFVPEKVRLLPYGAGGFEVRPSRPEPGRVLFVGIGKLRKGVAYLAEAARLLKESDPGVVVAVAGHVEPAIRDRAECAALTFLGHMSHDRLASEFARADLFCLPTLTEGSASSVYEALAYGLPVVTTASSGSVVRDGVEGVIAPERDGPALARAISMIARNRELRARMSTQALATAERYSDEACGAHFIDVVREALALYDARA